MSFLILRSRMEDTLIQANRLRDDAARLGIDDVVSDIRCPTCRTIRRVGRSRMRMEQDTPILGSFIFIRWDGSTYFANYIEDKYPFLGVMRLPQGGYATCSDKEVDDIGTPIPVAPIPAMPGPDPAIEYKHYDFGTLLEIDIGFMRGITGTVVRTKSDGQVVLKLVDNKGWKLSTLLIHVSALKVPLTAPVAA
jgi:hypothetical protein